MNGNAQKLIKYMDGASKRFVIPVYQRNYDWKMEHCKQLYDDLVKVIRQNRKSHFFGSIVSVQSESGTMEEFLIIDGQQRLTTVSLLLLAVHHLLQKGNVYSMNSKNKLYLFERLENAGTAETKDVWGHLDKGEYSIEHIMPQHLTPAWISELGEDYEEIHNIWLHRLSNLTLTAYNSKYSNSPFLDKRDMPHGFKDSGLRINQWIAQKERWGIDELEERGQYLRNRVTEIWTFPVSDYQPPEKQMDMVSLDEDVALTGRILSKYSFQGAEQPAASWVDMYQQVISSLHAQNKAVLTKLAVSQDTAADLTLHFSTSEDTFSSCRQIDTNIFVWTGTDTQYKINILRKLFALFGVEESELVFYLRDEENAEAATGSRHEIRKRYAVITSEKQSRKKMQKVVK